MNFYESLSETLFVLDKFGKDCIDYGYYDYLDLIGPLLDKVYNDIVERESEENYD